MNTLLNKVNAIILNPLITLAFAVALMYFLYGVYEFIKESDSEDARSKGREHILWGIIGMFIMISVYGIIRVLLTTFGVPIPDGIK